MTRCLSLRGSRFTKQDVDFPSEREYNDYLEMVDTYGTGRCSLVASSGVVRSSCRGLHSLGAVYNLVTGTDEEATKAKIAAYERANAQKIRQQLTKKVRGYSRVSMIT